MLICASAHEEIVYIGRPTACPLCDANDSLAKALAEVSRLSGRVKELETRTIILTGRIR